MKFSLKIAVLVLGCIAAAQTSFAETYSSEDQEQLTLECLLTNNKFASAFIAQDAAGYALGTASSPIAELNLVTNQPGVTAYYSAEMIAGGSLYWIRIVKGSMNILFTTKSNTVICLALSSQKMGKKYSTKIVKNQSR
ncbi:TPA: hypothetical protein ACNV5S_001235 [Citrobacter braakii]